MIYSLEGKWQADIGDGRLYPMILPGTLDENGIGGRDTGKNEWHPDSSLGNAGEDFERRGPILTRFTRKYTFEGEARLTCRVSFEHPEGKRLFLEAERARVLRVLVDGREVPDYVAPSISTPHVFELTDVWKGDHEITLLSDNSYPGLPHDDIVYSSAATDETQTNWNGVLGYVRLRVEDAVFPEAVRVYPSGDELTVKVSVSADRPWKGRICVESEALAEAAAMEIAVEKGITEIAIAKLSLTDGVKRWDEFEGNLYGLTARLVSDADCGVGSGTVSSKTVVFGVRDFGADADGRLALNGRTIFLRSEANCAEFPETGYCPMEVSQWRRILEKYKSYGVNCMRFHSHCPPEAAFTAADEMGMLMQPELSHWNPRDAFESEESLSCYRAELFGVIRMLANHPSFVMLTFGNELHASETGHGRMSGLLDQARRLDDTRLYANGSNVHYGAIGCDADSDFYTSSNYYEQELRGTFAGMQGYINHRYPGAGANYDGAMEKLRETYKKPVFGFEVGQFEILPDFDELEAFCGISDPASFRAIRECVEQKGLLPVWKRYVEATGELALIGYREEIEAALRTRQLSGISLLGLQDFPGQGTALVGMMNSHLESKPFDFAKPERFRTFFTSQLPLVLLPKYTYENTEMLEAEIEIANFGKEVLEGEILCRLERLCMPEEAGGKSAGEGGEAKGVFCAGGTLESVRCPVGRITKAGTLRIALDGIERPSRMELTVSIGNVSNRYPVWVYPPVKPVCPGTVYETTYLDQQAKAVLEAGGKVYLTPPSTREALPSSIQAQFTTDFWSVGTFSSQEGGMGQLIDVEHPIFRSFPTEFHTNWQWWPMAGRRAAILPGQYRAIVTQMDSYAYLRPMAQLLECRCGGGKLLFSTWGLQDLQAYPEARALLDSIYQYMDSTEFAPDQEIGWEVMRGLVKGVPGADGV